MISIIAMVILIMANYFFMSGYYAMVWMKFEYMNEEVQFFSVVGPIVGNIIAFFILYFYIEFILMGNYVAAGAWAVALLGVCLIGVRVRFLIGVDKMRERLEQ